MDAYGGFLFVHLGESPRPLLDELREGTESITNFERYHLETLRIGRRIVYEVEANWKIVVENYNECLHCPTVHPELVQIVPLYRFGEVWDEETRDDGNWMIEGATSFTRTGRSTLPPFPDLSPDDRRMYYGTFQFPNVLLNLHPDAAMVYTLYPRGPGHTTVVSEYLFAPETIAAPDFSPDPVVELWDLISKQDWVICSRAQTGVSSRAYRSGDLPAQGSVPLRLQRALPRGDGPAAPRLNGRLPARPRCHVPASGTWVVATPTVTGTGHRHRRSPATRGTT